MPNKFVNKLLDEMNSDEIIKFTDKDNFKEVSRWIPTGLPELDFNLGTLGLPPGIVEVAGKSRSGKTTFSLHVGKYFQKLEPNGVIIILSSENRDNKQYAQKIGIDTDSVIIIKSKYVEDLFFKYELTRKRLQKLWEEEGNKGSIPILLIWDSVGGTLSRAESETFDENVKALEKSIEKGTKFEISHAQVAAFAKNAKMMIKSVLGNLYSENITLIAINHTGDKIGNMQKGRKSYGGEWVEYLPTIRLETILIGHEKIDDVEVAQQTKIKVVKNDFGSRKVTDIDILLGVGFMLSEVDIEYAVKHGIIQKEGKTGYTFLNGKIKWTSKRSFYQCYEVNKKLMDLLHNKVIKARHNDVLREKGLLED
jgi:RecA/RadA recombinase